MGEKKIIKSDEARKAKKKRTEVVEKQKGVQEGQDGRGDFFPGDFFERGRNPTDTRSYCRRHTERKLSLPTFFFPLTTFCFSKSC